MFFYFGLLTSVLYNTKLMLLLSFPVFTGLILLLLQIYVKFELINNINDDSSISD